MHEDKKEHLRARASHAKCNCLPDWRAWRIPTFAPACCALVQESYDVYVADKQPLPEGEEKHVISVFVADEAGLINRVAGVFARRGALLAGHIQQHPTAMYHSLFASPHRHLYRQWCLSVEQSLP